MSTIPDEFIELNSNWYKERGQISVAVPYFIN